jgi:hypothetical protein
MNKTSERLRAATEAQNDYDAGYLAGLLFGLEGVRLAPSQQAAVKHLREVYARLSIELQSRAAAQPIPHPETVRDL